MSINSIPDKIFYAPQPWIDLAPDYDWAKLVPPPAPTPVTATAPTADDTADTYTIPTTEGVQYLVDGAVVAAGTVSVGDVDATVAVTAEALEGYVLEGTASWTLTFTKVPAPTPVTATAPTFDDVADTYRIPQKAGVQYLVDGVPTTSGVKTVGDVDATVTVTAEAKEGYVLEGTASWTGTFTKAPAPEPEEPTDPEGGGDA